MPRRRVLATLTAFFPLLIAAASAQPASDAPALLGRIDGDSYVSPSGAFEVAIPIMLDLNGQISDTPNVVTFQDAFTHVSIAAIPEDMTQKWELQTDGPKKFLQDFFERSVFPDFVRADPKASCDLNALYNQAFGGSLVTFVLLPGGSMFDGPGMRIAPENTPPVAKRGNLLFVHDGYIYVISAELGERVTEGSAYHLTAEQENRLLRDRLFNIAAKIRFLATTSPAAG